MEVRARQIRGNGAGLRDTGLGGNGVHAALTCQLRGAPLAARPSGAPCWARCFRRSENLPLTCLHAHRNDVHLFFEHLNQGAFARSLPLPRILEAKKAGWRRSLLIGERATLQGHQRTGNDPMLGFHRLGILRQLSRHPIVRQRQVDSLFFLGFELWTEIDLLRCGAEAPA